MKIETTEEAKMKKQTAANNTFLRQVKTLMNGKVYQKVLGLVNSEGENAAREYLQGFFRQPINSVFPKS